jgi:hypothetical protein
MIELRLLGLMHLRPSQVSPRYGNQFCAVLELAEGSGSSLTAETMQALEDERFALALKMRLR